MMILSNEYAYLPCKRGFLWQSALSRHSFAQPQAFDIMYGVTMTQTLRLLHGARDIIIAFLLHNLLVDGLHVESSA